MMEVEDREDRHPPYVSWVLLRLASRCWFWMYLLTPLGANRDRSLNLLHSSTPYLFCELSGLTRHVLESKCPVNLDATYTFHS